MKLHYYLRISPIKVLQTLIHVHQSHQLWFNDHLLQQVLVMVGPKIKELIQSKSEYAQVLRSDGFQVSFRLEKLDSSRSTEIIMNMDEEELNQIELKKKLLVTSTTMLRRTHLRKLSLYSYQLILVIEPFDNSCFMIQQKLPDFLGFIYQTQKPIADYFTTHSK